MWFEKLTGFHEGSPKQVREKLSVENGVLRSKVNGNEYRCGILETPSLAELRERVGSASVPLGRLRLNERVADAQQLHRDEANAGALFQVASQFNLLEMISPNYTPEHGVDRYQMDPTQGPACAIAAGAGTIYRNYFVDCHGQVGQTEKNQIDCLADMGVALGNTDNRLWEMRNGYALASKEGLEEINEKIASCSEVELDAIRQKLRIGVQWNTQVTISNANHVVTQAYCSALPVAYSPQSSELWSKFAQLVLEASYEATICAGILNAQKNQCNKVFLTQVGGGAFGNEYEWISKAILRALRRYQQYDLQVFMVSFGYPNPKVQQLIEDYQACIN